ncbi:MAG: MT-A70 family methyltransferase [bacterium]|nr:MT-A70 family methyltransferase [bacterium]
MTDPTLFADIGADCGGVPSPSPQLGNTRKFVTSMLHLAKAMEIRTLLGELDSARRQAGLSKTELARIADTQPAAVRRLLSGNGHNPQVSTLAALAEVLGCELRLVPKSKNGRPAAIESVAEAAAELQQIRGGPFSTLLADPPWRFQNRTGKVAPEHRRLSRYDTMTTAAIRALPISEITTPDAHLYLWTPNALIADALAVMESWGFTYKSNIVWAKRRKDGGPDGRGVGFYFRNVTELILFGVKGTMRTLAPGRRQVNMIETRKREHSRKPDEQYDIIESCSPGPYLELFARYSRSGWTSWGTEAEDEITPRGKRYPAYS